MINFWKKLRIREHSGSSEFAKGELEQANVRVVVAAVIVLYAFARMWSAGDLLATLSTTPVILALSFLTVALVSWLTALKVIRLEGWIRKVHRIVFIVVDTGATSVALVLTGEVGSPIYIVYLVNIIGNGVRYGPGYLVISAVSSVAGFATVLLITPFWTEQPALGWGLWVGLFVLPTYVYVLIRRLDHALKEAREASAAKSRFVASISHELRTPLNGVLASAELMEEYPLESEMRVLLGNIRSSAKAQLSLVNDILDLTKIEAGKMDVHHDPCALVEVLRECREIVVPRAQQKNVSVEVFVDAGIPSVLLMSADHLRQVLVNLAGNAVKFTDSGNVSISAMVSTSNEFRLTIEDTGIGIPLEEQNRVFEAFAQVDERRSRRYEGTGLGTTITKQLVELMGGSIALESEVGVGTKVNVFLPMLPAPSASKQRSIEADVLVHGVPDAALDQITPPSGVKFVSQMTEIVEHRMRNASGKVVLVDMSDGKLGRLRGSSGAMLSGQGKNAVVAWGYPGSDEELIGTVAFTAVDETSVGAGIGRAIDYIDSNEEPRGKTRRYRSLRILVAEDNAVNQQVIQAGLEQEGHVVTMVPDGESALDALGQEMFDVMILDMHMPGMTGAEVARIYRFSVGSSSTPILLLTADVTPEVREEASKARVERVLAKPCGKSEMLQNIYEVLDGRNVVPLVEETPEEVTCDLVDPSKLEELLSLTPRGPEFVKEIVDAFNKDSATTIAEISSNMSKGKVQSVAHGLHALRGCCLSVGAQAMLQTIEQLRGVPRREMIQDGAGLVEKLLAVQAQTVARLDAELASLSDSVH